MTLHLTPSAAKHIQSILSRHPEAVGLRVGLKPSGCAQYSYVIDVANIVDPEMDIVIESEGVKVVVDKASLEKISDTEIDYEQQGLNSMLVFNNPHAAHSCGCGESFSL